MGSPAGAVQFFLDGVALGAVQTLTAGANNTSTATVTSTALTAGSHFVTIAYTPSGATNPYVAFTVNTITADNGVALIETAKKAFTPGNLIVVQRGDGNVNLGSSGYLVFLDEYTTAGALVQQIALPNADAGSTHGLLLSGQSGAEGLLNRSYLTIAGYDLPVGRQFVTSTFPFQYPRTIARIDNAGNLDTSTAISAASPTSVPYNPLDVISSDGNQFWLAGSLNTGNNTDSGIEYVGSLGATSAIQIGPAGSSGAAIGIAGGQLYAATNDLNGGTRADVWKVGTGLPTTAGQTLATLPGLQSAYNGAFAPDAPNPEQFLFLNHNDGTSNNPDTLFIADQAHGLLKFSFDGTSWSFQASTSTTVTPSTNPVATGVADTLTATITVPAGTLPTGTVTFKDGGTALGNGTLSQVAVNHLGNPVITFVATLPATFSTVGSHIISAVYNGDTNFATSTDTTTVAVVNSTTTTVTTSNPNPTAATATSVTLTATVASASGTPTGTVQFYDNLIAVGTPVTLNASGVGTATISTALLQAAGGAPDVLTPGLHSISAVYAPDAAGAGSFFTSTGVYEQAVQAQAFGASDEFVFRVGDGTTPIIAQAPNVNAGQGSVGNTVFIDEYAPAGALVQSIILPSADGTGTQNIIHALVADGQQSATGQLTLSGDGQYLFVTGYDASPLLSTTAPLLHTTSSVSRAVARIKYDGTVQTISFTAGPSGIQTSGNINGVYSPDGNQFYISGTAGLYYSSSFTPSAALQNPTKITSTTYTVTGLESDGTNLDIVGTPNSGGVLVGAYSGFPTAAAPAPSNLPGLPGTDTFQLFPIDVFFTHLNGATAPAGINTMYISDDGPSFAHGAITKWALVSGSWTLVDTITAGTNNSAVSFYWLAGQTDATGKVTLYTSYANGGNSNTGPGFLYAAAMPTATTPPSAPAARTVTRSVPSRR